MSKHMAVQAIQFTKYTLMLSRHKFLTRSKSSFGTISNFATFPWNFFDKYEITSLSQFWKNKKQTNKKILYLDRFWTCLHNIWTKVQTYLFSGNVKIWLKGEGHLQTEETPGGTCQRSGKSGGVNAHFQIIVKAGVKCVKLVSSLNQLCYISPTRAHLKPAPILLYKIVVHGADHPLVFIQDLCLHKERGVIIFTVTSAHQNAYRAQTWHCAYLQGAYWSTSPFSRPGPSSGQNRSGRPSRRWTGCAPAAWGRTSTIHRPWFKHKCTATS